MSKNINSTIFTPVLIGGSLILLISFAIRSTFGLFQIPIAEQFMWARSEFSMAIAIQNLAWGIGTPIFSAFAEKFGDRKAITIGLVLYALGILISSTASSAEAHQFLNILIGFGIAGSGFGPILAVVGRTASAEKRSLALGITTAAGSAGHQHLFHVQAVDGHAMALNSFLVDNPKAHALEKASSGQAACRTQGFAASDTGFIFQMLAKQGGDAESAAVRRQIHHFDMIGRVQLGKANSFTLQQGNQCQPTL